MNASWLVQRTSKRLFHHTIISINHQQTLPNDARPSTTSSEGSVAAAALEDTFGLHSESFYCYYYHALSDSKIFGKKIVRRNRV